MLKKIFILIIITLSITITPVEVAKAGLAKPLGNPIVNSWFDHNDPNSAGIGNNLMIRYDGVTWTNADRANCQLHVSCYDGHDAIDFQATTGTNVLAAEGGTVTTYWDTLGGNVTRVSHASLGYSTYYMHLNTYIITSGTTYRGQVIATSGCSGSACTGAHLHFTVRDSTSSGGNVMDPYGWTGVGSDPYPYNQGELWGNSSCTPPGSGDWNIPTSGCTITSYVDSTTHNIIIPNGATLSVDGSSAHLDVDFDSNKIIILDGGTLLIKNDGKVE